jgi:hypothetical protein
MTGAGRACDSLMNTFGYLVIKFDQINAGEFNTIEEVEEVIGFVVGKLDVMNASDNGYPIKKVRFKEISKFDEKEAEFGKNGVS